VTFPQNGFEVPTPVASVEVAIRAVLSDLENQLRALYGQRLVRLVLFGSQARGDADEGSDIDVLVVLGGPVDAYRTVHHSHARRAGQAARS
jgi:predicted nucleotidyltransferase